MPLKIDKWRGSPAVRAMHPTARSGYLDLILSQWQTDECSLSSDQVDLAEQSFLGDELWALHGPRILRNFVTLQNGRLRNMVCFEEWEEARRVFHSTHKTLSPEELHEKRSAAGTNGNKVRWGDRKPSQVATDLSQTDPKPSLTGTETGTVTKKQIHTANGKPSPECVSLYQAYPRHVAPDTAYRAITKALARKPFAELLAAVTRFATQCRKEQTEAQFIPHPATWFNAGRYDDGEVLLGAVRPKSQYELNTEAQLEERRQAIAAAGVQ